MRKFIMLSFLFLVIYCFNLKAENKLIRISTNKTDLIFKVAENGRLCQSYLGASLKHESDFDHLKADLEAYLSKGDEDYFEPAVSVLHNDGNPSLQLKYMSHGIKQLQAGVTETTILLKDDKYPVEIKLIFTSFANENIIKERTEIKHNEKKSITLYLYASSLLSLNANKYYLTEFCGDWMREAAPKEQSLYFGQKIIDSKLGTKAATFSPPVFILSLDQKAQENEGDVLFGTLAWTGNYRFNFEVDNKNKLRIISGINPYASEYSLKPGEVFDTPEFIFTYSTHGKGQASRDMHDWARRYQLKDGMGKRMSLLNNWESTFFDFNEDKLLSLIGEAKKLGVDLFLLDDGWFGSKYPRNDDFRGLGDWTVNKNKLPHGISYLIKEANEQGVKFGIWIEPEMVNPKSKLFEEHPDWAILLPNRKPFYNRNQLVLDMSHPKVQNYVFGIVDDLMTQNPGLAYFKWDCNSIMTNVYSNYLKNKQSHLYIEYVRGVSSVWKRIKTKYPDLPMMLCASGGGRCDYEALKYFTEFWTSDDTHAVERIYIQWGISHFFPVKSMAAHVTNTTDTPLKFRLDVAMMCKLGFDIQMKELTKDEQELCYNGVKNFNRLQSTILDGDQYRLVSPYESDHAVILYVSKNKNKAVLFSYDIHPRMAVPMRSVCLNGLDPDKNYKIEEINLLGDRKPMDVSGKIFSGDYLMKVGIDILTDSQTTSHVFELITQ
jgi:alpha-galactosidase